MLSPLLCHSQVLRDAEDVGSADSGRSAFLPTPSVPASNLNISVGAATRAGQATLLSASDPSNDPASCPPSLL